MSEGSNQPGIIDALADVYGPEVRRQWDQHVRTSGARNDVEQVLSWETRPTAEDTFFLREPNLKDIAKSIYGTPAQPAQILDIGCSLGSEPYELALRILGNGQEYFSIDGIDVGEELLDQARTGTFTLPIPHEESVDQFINTQIEAHRLTSLGTEVVDLSRYGRPNVTVENYSLSSEVKSKMQFHLHDIIDEPFEAAQPYDAAVCNNVLLHYPLTTRTVILSHILQPLKENAFVGLEKIRDVTDKSRPSVAGLENYYQWRQNLGDFGLMPVSSGRSDIYRYDPNNNIYRDKRLGIRGRDLVELPPRIKG